jgi:hypothetical protein
MLTTLKYLNMGLAFLLELGVLGALGYWGFMVGQGTLTNIGLGIGTPLLAAGIWSWWGAPRSSHRLKGFSFLILRILFFGAGCLALFAVSSIEIASLFTLLVIINLSLIYLLHQ